MLNCLTRFSPIDSSLRASFLYIWFGLVISFQLTFAQVENKNPSFNFPSNNNDDSNSLFRPPPEESPYLKGDFMEKPLDMTDPALDDDSPKTNMEEQEKFLNPGSLQTSDRKVGS